MTEILPCPFCGGEAEFHDQGFEDDVAYMACTKCRVSTLPSYAGYDDHLSMWNRRTPPAASAPVGELRDWIDLLRVLAAKGEMLVMGRLTELADFLETLGDRQVMREALMLILSDSGWDAALVKGANPVIFARMGDIHQTADHALSSVPPVAAPPAPTLEGIDELRKLVVEWRKGPIVSSDSCSHCCADDLEKVLQHITPMQEEKK